MAFTWDDPERPQRGVATPPAPSQPGPAAPPAAGNAPTGINPQSGFAYGSQEDNAFYGPQGASQTRNGMDPAYVKSRVYYLSTLPGANPSLKSDPDYWTKQFIANGGWKSDGTSEVDPYWQNKAMQPEGAPAGGDQADLLAPFTEKLQLDPFAAPTGVDESNDPGYMARLGILQDARQRQAAAQGNLLSGSTSTALDKQASDYASQEYGNVYNRAYQTWQGNQQQKLTGYQARENTFYANQNNPFAKLYAMSSLDSQNQNALNQLNLGYAGLGASTIAGGGNQYAGYLTQGGNATAAGQVGAGNAYAGAFGQVSQLPFQYAAYNSIFNKPPATVH